MYFKIICQDFFRYGLPKVYMVPECWKKFPIVLYFPKGSKLVSKFDNVIGRLNQAGIIQKWKKDEMDEVALKKKLEFVSLGNEVLSLEDLSVAFGVAGFGTLISFITFAAEVVMRFHKVLRCQEQRREN